MDDHGRLQRPHPRRRRRDRHRAPPAAHRGPQGRVGLRRRRDQRLAGHQDRRSSRRSAASTSDARTRRPLGRRAARRRPRRARAARPLIDDKVAPPRCGSPSASARSADSPARPCRPTRAAPPRSGRRRRAPRSCASWPPARRSCSATTGTPLPVAPADGTARIALLGHNAVHPFTQGGGCAFVTPAARERRRSSALRAAFPEAEVDAAPRRRPRLLPPALDLGGCCTDPRRRARHRASSCSTPTGPCSVTTDVTGCREPLVPRCDDDAVASRAPAHRRRGSTSPARHVVGVGTRRRRTASRSTAGALGSPSTSVGAEVVLDSSVQPTRRPSRRVDRGDRAARPCESTPIVQVDRPRESYGRFVRAALAHRAPGPHGRRGARRAPSRPPRQPTSPSWSSAPTPRPSPRAATARTSPCPARQNELVRRVAGGEPAHGRRRQRRRARAAAVARRGAAVLWCVAARARRPDALAAVLTGVTEPTGRLPWTLPARRGRRARAARRPRRRRHRLRRGRSTSGYRGWDRLGRTPAPRFGYGLGWPTWEYRWLELVDAASGRARDAGSVDRSSSPRHRRQHRRARRPRGRPGLPRAARRRRRRAPCAGSRGFAVVDAPPGEHADVHVPSRRRVLRDLVDGCRGWILPAGTYRVRVGRSSRDLRLETRRHAVSGCTHHRTSPTQSEPTTTRNARRHRENAQARTSSPQAATTRVARRRLALSGVQRRRRRGR